MHTWACFECRTTVRRQPSAESVRCASCGKDCEHLGTKVPIPRKTDKKGWEALLERFLRTKREVAQDIYERRVELTHATEREIARLETLPHNEGRRVAVRELKKRLREL